MSQYEPIYDGFGRGTQERYVPNARMSVSSSVFLPGSDVDIYTGILKPDRQRRCRTQGKRLEIERLEREQKSLEEAVRREMGKRGPRISRRLGIFLCALLLFACGMCILVQEGTLAQRQKELNQLESAIKDCQNQNEALQAQISEASDEAVICYAASQNLSMIPAESAEAIHLVAVDTRPLESSQRVTGLNETDGSVQEEAQSTHVPVMASN